MTLTIAGVRRFRPVSVSCGVIVALLNLWLAPAYAQTAGASARGAQPAQARVENMQVVISGALVNITYDLIASAPSTFAVELEASEDGGRTYTMKPKTVTGSVGAGVAPGVGKKMVWEAAKDTDNLQLAQLKFRVQAKAEASPSIQPPVVPTGVPTQPPARPAVPGTGATAPRSQANGPGGRNSLLWPGLGMIGGGILLGALAAAGPLKSEDNDPSLEDCLSFSARAGFPASNCDSLRHTITNTPVVGAGLGIAVAGAVLLVLGKRRASQLPSIAPLRKGFVIYHAIQF